MPRRPKVTIVGAGLGGLTAATAFIRAGIEVAVCEQAAELNEIGAGINLTPNVLRALRYLDLDDEVLARAFRPERHVFRNWKSGRILFQARVKGEYERHFGAPVCNVHRADLHDVLRAGVPVSAMRLGAECVGVRQAQGNTIVTLRDGTEIESDMVVGADGIRSSVRQSLFGRDAPSFTGNIAWRFTVPADELPDGLIKPDITNWLGPGGHVVHYYVRAGLVNVVAVHETEQWTEESWALRADRSEPMAVYAGWNDALLQLFERAATCFKWGLFDREPLEQWSVGHVTLLGDAAHPMLPFMGQGAAMAIEDGLALALLLADNADPPAVTLKRYEALRLPRTRSVQLGSRGRAAENHLRSPMARLRRDIGFLFRQWFRPHGTLHRAGWVYNYDVKDACANPDALRSLS
jgi:salicylate hydroxylase